MEGHDPLDDGQIGLLSQPSRGPAAKGQSRLGRVGVEAPMAILLSDQSELDIAAGPGYHLAHDMLSSPPVAGCPAVPVTRHGSAEPAVAREGGSRSVPRHPGDAVRVVVGAVIFTGGAIAARQGLSRFEIDIFRLVNDLPGALALPLIAVMQLGSFAAVPVTTVVALVARRPRLARDVGAAGTAAYLLAKVAKMMVARARPGALLSATVLRGASDTGLGFPSGHVAVAAALATAAGPHLGRRTRRTLWAGVTVVGVARIYVGAHLPIDVLGGAALGWMVGAALHLAWGAPRLRLPGPAVAQTLQEAGFPVSHVASPPLDARGSTPFVVDGGDRNLFVKAVGREQRNADLLFKAWRWLAFRHVEDEAPFATPKQAVEHEAYVALLAARAGVRTPAVLATVGLAPSTALLVEEQLPARGLDTLTPDEISDGLLTDMWTQVARLRGARIAHRDLRLANVMMDGAGRAWVVDFGFAEAAAGPRRLDQDVAQLLASSALAVGSRRAVTAAAEILGRDAVALALPLLQPAALSAATRQALRRQPGLLDDLRRQAGRDAGVELAPPVPLTRIRPRTVLTLALLGVAVHLLLPQAGEVRHTFHALRGARWEWLAAALLASAATYPAAALARLGSVEAPLPLGTTTAVQLAGSFVNRLTPASLGGAGLNERYLERQGLERPAAVAGVAAVSAAGVLVHGASLAVALILVGRAGIPSVHLPHRWPLLVAVVAGLSAVGLTLRAPLRRRLLSGLHQTSRALLATLRRPVRATQLLGGSLAVTAGYVLTLAICLHTFGAGVSLERVAAAFLGGTALAAAAPTPGGLGAVEAALVAALTGLGAQVGPAVAGVLAFRLVTFWLPILPGWLALRSLRRHGAI
jgi:undecaprenyl-diphosphatase